MFHRDHKQDQRSKSAAAPTAIRSDPHYTLQLRLTSPACYKLLLLLWFSIASLKHVLLLIPVMLDSTRAALLDSQFIIILL